MNISTEEKILQAAERVFQQKGFSGARMQEIADQAQINKGLLHYYFRTKDKLFEAIFRKSFNHMMFRLESILSSSLPLFDKLEMFIGEYMEMLLKNPALPKFVINELNNNAEQFIQANLNSRSKHNLTIFMETIQQEVNAKRIRAVDPRQLFINIVSLCVFPFIGRPLIQVVLQQDKQQFMELMQERKQHVLLFLKHALSP